MKMRQIRRLLVITLFAAAGFCPNSVECKALDREAMDPLQTISDFADSKRQYTISPQGIYTFYYVLPESSRFEERTASGEVRGNYAYIAPEGEKFKFKYEAGKKGFQVESNALPSAPEDTDEVKKAKEVFFEAYQKALALAELEEEVKGVNKGHDDVQKGKGISRSRGRVENVEVERVGGEEDGRNGKGRIGGGEEKDESDDDEESSEELSDEDDESSEESSEEDDDDESSEEDDDEESSEEDDDEESSEEDDDEESSEEDDESSEEDDESDEDVRKSLNISGRLNHNNQRYNAPRRRRLIRVQQPDIKRISSHINKSSNQNKPQNTDAKHRQNTGTKTHLNQPQLSHNQLQNYPLKIARNSYFIRNSNRNQIRNSRRNQTHNRRINSTPDLSHDSIATRNPNPNNRHFNRVHNTIDRHLNRNHTEPTNRNFSRTQRRKIPRSHTESARLRISRQPITRSRRRPTKRFILLP